MSKTSHPPLQAKLARAQQLATSGRTADAIRILENLCRKYTRNAEVWFMQGVTHGSAGKFMEATRALQQAVSLRPDHALSHFNLGNALAALGRLPEAIAAYEKTTSLEPANPTAWHALCKARLNAGQLDATADCYRRYLELRPDDADATGNLATCCFHLGKLEEAAITYTLALTKQRKASFLDGLGATLCQQGRLEDAISAHREAVSMQPDDARSHSNLLLCLNYQPGLAPDELLEEHEKWGKKVTRHYSRPSHYNQSADPERKLRIGYVSPDFRTHSVAYFFSTLLLNHDSNEVEVWCYATTLMEDETTTRLQEASHHWRNISKLNDRQAIHQIQQDSIDILVDLAGHTAGNRLPLFAGKPAPLQITWLGYPATTGIATIDYRLTDSVADPEGAEHCYSEELIRLSDGFLCYTPPAETPPVAPPPVVENGFITFGSFNNLAKINQRVIATWSELLKLLPDSRMYIKNPSLSDNATADRYLALFDLHGIPAERVMLQGLAPTMNEHLDCYRHIDISLDTFPYNGTTTTCEALYMGVPVITVTGNSHAGRVGTSILSSLGLEESIASTQDDYIRKAAALAGDQDRLTELRLTIRSTMESSPLCKGDAFAQKMEQCYRKIWKDWCDTQFSVN